MFKNGNNKSRYTSKIICQNGKTGNNDLIPPQSLLISINRNIDINNNLSMTKTLFVKMSKPQITINDDRENNPPKDGMGKEVRCCLLSLCCPVKV